jgi:hypothetical protein
VARHVRQLTPAHRRLSRFDPLVWLGMAATLVIFAIGFGLVGGDFMLRRSRA